MIGTLNACMVVPTLALGVWHFANPDERSDFLRPPKGRWIVIPLLVPFALSR
jgi:hypothetical protein